MEKIAEGIYKVDLTDGSPANNLIHIYIIPGGEDGRVLMLDAGYRTQANKDIMTRELKEAGIPFDKLDIFLTHKHHDHTGLANFYADRGARIYLNEEESHHPFDCIYYDKEPQALSAQQQVLRTLGISPELNEILYERMMDLNKQVQALTTPSILNELHNYKSLPIRKGQRFFYGDFCLKAYALRGHTYGQMGLYDSNKKIVFSADQVIDGIVPIVGTSYVGDNLLDAYFNSLFMFPVKFQNYTAYPAHLDPFICDGRVSSRILHAYQKKIGILYHILLAGGKHTVQELAFRCYGISEDFGWKNLFETMSIISKTFSCLEYLRGQGLARCDEHDGTLYFSRACYLDGEELDEES